MSGQRQFYLEEDFPVHPKTVKAGGDAAWLYVCGMAWASKHLTGDIPKSMVPQLSDRRKPMILAERLCDAGLWHDHTDHYEIHDFETRNKKSLARRRKAKHAAERRWQDYDPDAPSMPQASDGDAPSIAQAMLNGCSTSASSEPTNQRTNEPTTKDLALASDEHSSPLSVVRDFEHEPPNHTAALKQMARRDMHERRRDRPDLTPIDLEVPYMMRAAQRRRVNFADVLARLSPDLDVNVVIQEIDAADKHRQNDRHPWDCVCEGTGMVAAESGLVLCEERKSA